MYKLLPKLERVLKRLPGFWKQLESNRLLPDLDKEQLQAHVVIVGFGRIGKHLVNVLRELNISQLVIESDMERVEAINQTGIATLYGDAANSEVLAHAGLEQARALVVTVPEDGPAAMIVASARDLNPKLPIVARAATEGGVQHLRQLGASDVVHPELEGGLEMVYDTLLHLGYPLREVHEYAEAVRRDAYNFDIDQVDEQQTLRGLVAATEGITILWVALGDGNALVGQTLQESDIRARTGASVIAVVRDQHIIANPKSSMQFRAGDRLGLIGEPEQLADAQTWLASCESGCA